MLCKPIRDTKLPAAQIGVGALAYDRDLWAGVGHNSARPRPSVPGGEIPRQEENGGGEMLRTSSGLAELVPDQMAPVSGHAPFTQVLWPLRSSL